MASVSAVPMTRMVPVAIFGATNGLPSAASPPSAYRAGQRRQRAGDI